jgi:hypothetical protein
VLQDRINYPIELQVEARGADLMEFGEKIDKGEIQIGAVWGIEYGWLHERFPKLEMMSHLSQHAGTQGWPVQIMVRNDYSRERITDLPVCRVARIRTRVADKHVKGFIPHWTMSGTNQGLSAPYTKPSGVGVLPSPQELAMDIGAVRAPPIH